MDKELEFIKEYLGKQAMFGDSVGYGEMVLQAITGFCTNFKNYEGQEEDKQKLISKIKEYPKLDIKYVYDVLKDNQPWNIQNVL